MRATLLIGLLLTLLVHPGPADAADLCSGTAQVSWATDFELVTVEGARVDVPGCADGEPVGLQLITDDGDVPEDGPIMGAAENEKAMFDLSGLEQGIEPLIGARVFLKLAEEEPVFFDVTVDRRYFNSGGSEQRGLRQVTSLQVPPDGEYVVPDAPTGYQDVACTEVNTSIGDDVIEQGSGTFVATASGRHLACYQQVPGARPGIPDDQEPEVLDEVLTAEGAEVQVLGAVEHAPSATGTGRLATTGSDLGLMVLVGALLLVGGLRLVVGKRPDSRTAAPRRTAAGSAMDGG